MFSNWITVINEHYENIGRNSTRFRNRINELFSEFSNEEFEDFHKLIKHYKDNDTADDKANKFRRISKLVEEFQEKYGNIEILSIFSAVVLFAMGEFLSP